MGGFLILSNFWAVDVVILVSIYIAMQYKYDILHIVIIFQRGKVMKWGGGEIFKVLDLPETYTSLPSHGQIPLFAYNLSLKI